MSHDTEIAAEATDVPEMMQVDGLAREVDAREVDHSEENDEEINKRMMEKLIDEAKEDMDRYKLMRDGASSSHARANSRSRRHQETTPLVRNAPSNTEAIQVRPDSPATHTANTLLSVRQQVNLIQQERQEREVQQRQNMNDFLDELDQEIDDATPVGTKNKYRPIQDDFEVN